MLRRHLLTRLVAASVTLRCASGSNDEELWHDYLKWYRSRPAGESSPLSSYLEHLRQAKLTEAEIANRRSTLERLIRERREELRPLFFDRTYSARAPGTARFNTEPNQLLVETIRERSPGRALDIHMGQGRNAIYLASQGWEVTGFDYSAQGVKQARAAAEAAGVRLNASVERHEGFDFGRERWDLILMSYTWVPLREPWVERIIASLKPGGILVFEHMMDESESTQAAPWLPRPNQLLQVFGALRILRYEDRRAPADWSWRPERVARLVAEKPATS